MVPVSLAALIGGLLGGLLSAYRSVISEINSADWMDDRWELVVGLFKVSVWGALAGVLLVNTGKNLINLETLGIGKLEENLILAGAIGLLGGLFSDQVIGKAARKVGLLEAQKEQFQQLAGQIMVSHQAMAAQEAIVARTVQAVRSQAAVGAMQGEEGPVMARVSADPAMPWAPVAPPMGRPLAPAVATMAALTGQPLIPGTTVLIQQMNKVLNANSVAQVRAAVKDQSSTSER